MAFLRQPYPFDTSFWRRVFKGVVIAVVIFLAVYLVPLPERYQYDRPTWEVAGWIAGVVFFLWTMVNLLMPGLFRKFFYTQRWTLGTHLLWVIGFIVVIWVVLIPFLAIFLSRELEGIALDRGIWMVMGVSLIVVFLVVFIRFFVSKSGAVKSAEQLNELLEKSNNHHGTLRAAIHIHERGKSVLNVVSEKLLYVQADGKFAYGYCMEDGQVKRYLVRRQLKSIAEDLDSLPQLAMCHPDYLVNVDNIDHFSGNAQGVHLHVKGDAVTLPISPACLDELREKMSA